MMTITLTPNQERFVQIALQTGRYKSIEDVIAAAFEMLEMEDRTHRQWLEETRDKTLADDSDQRIVLDRVDCGGKREAVIRRLVPPDSCSSPNHD
jgi:putative addiction module CopG family antidote